MIIWLASYPKSGNTWVRSFIGSLLYTKDGNSDFANLYNISQYPLKSHFSNICKDLKDINEIKKYWELSQDIINLDFLRVKEFSSKLQKSCSQILLLKDQRLDLLSHLRKFSYKKKNLS